MLLKMMQDAQKMTVKAALVESFSRVSPRWRRTFAITPSEGDQESARPHGRRDERSTGAAAK